MELTRKKCVPCESGMPPMSEPEVVKYLQQVSGWQTDNSDADLQSGRSSDRKRRSKKIWKSFKFKDYIQTIGFVNKVALLAQEEGHHPDMEVHYSRVKIELWTHAIGGLSENDFILAAKIDDLN